jgi:transcriptional regulator with XRE-family HTH domain
MPRRRTPDPLAQAVGQRIRQLRQEAGLTMEKLAFESELGSKGHLSNIERGLARPTVQTLQVLADRLGVLLLDLVTFPEADDRQRVIDLTRTLPKGPLRKLLRELSQEPAAAVTPKPVLQPRKPPKRGAG